MFPYFGPTNPSIIKQARLAQLAEQLICNQPVGGSSPSLGTTAGSNPVPGSRGKHEIPGNLYGMQSSSTL